MFRLSLGCKDKSPQDLLADWMRAADRSPGSLLMLREAPCGVRETGDRAPSTCTGRAEFEKPV